MADIEEDTYLDAADAMDGPMEPKTPCDWMPTRACVVWTDDVTQHYPVNQCAEVCWRYRRPVEKEDRA